MTRIGRVTAWVLAAVLCGAALPAAAGTTERISVNRNGVQGNDASDINSVSADGRFVAFASLADNLSATDAIAFRDVFVKDRQSGEAELISADFLGGAADGNSDSPVISSDGRFVAFVSDADDLVLNDGNGARDIFLRDRQQGVTFLVSITDQGFQTNGDSDLPSISGDGRFVSFASLADNIVFADNNLAIDVFQVDTITGDVLLVSATPSGFPGNGDSVFSSVSGDGQFVAFSSEADNFVAGDSNGVADVFVWTRATGNVVRASVSTTGVQGNGPSDIPSLDADGSVVAFASLANNLVAGDTNAARDVFVRELVAPATARVSVATNGIQGNADSDTPSISNKGRFVAFASDAANLVSGDTNSAADVFVHDRQTGLTVRMSVTTTGTEGNADSLFPAIGAEGNDVAFASLATNLVTDDTNGVADVFVNRWISFPDVSPEFSAFREIEATVSAGIVRGFSDGLFHPTAVVTRSQMAIFLARAIAGSDEAVPAGPTTPTFPDVPTTLASFRHIEFLVSLGIVKGFSDGTFGPFVEANRGQMAIFVARAVAGSDAAVPPGPATATFTDVPTTSPFFRYVEFLVSRDIVRGFSDGLYHPEVLVTRAQMAVFVTRAFDLPLPGA